MKKKQLSGKPLSRNELQTINGGKATFHCTTAQWATCSEECPKGGMVCDYITCRCVS